MWRKIRAFLTQGMLATVASQCGGDDGRIFVPGGDNEGTITIAVTDAPVDTARQVVVQFTSLDLIPDSGDEVNLDFSDRGIDLLSFTDGATTNLVANQTVEADTYTGLRINIRTDPSALDASSVTTDDGQFPLVITDDDDVDRLEITRNFTVPQDGNITLVVDFDLRSSVIDDGSRFRFRPTLRVVDNSSVGNISGTIDSDLVPNGCSSPYVYIFSGNAIAPDDIEFTSDDVDPLVSVPVRLNVASNTYRYRASFLEAGNYTVTYTCDGDLDNPETNDSLVFSAPVNATVTANQTLTLDFT